MLENTGLNNKSDLSIKIMDDSSRTNEDIELEGYEPIGHQPRHKKKSGGISGVLMSPARFVGRNLKQGGVKGSIFSLITAILGSGTITLPFLAYNNGIYVAAVLIIFGAILSYFCGMLLISCADKVGSDKYEDFAEFCYGRKMALVTGWSNVSTMLGFVISYIVFLK